MKNETTKEKPILRSKTISEIKEMWEHILKMDLRSRLKAYRSIENDIKKNYSAKTTPVEEIEVYLQILRTTKVTPSLFSRMFIRWLELTGNANPTVLVKKSGKVDVESGCIHVADPTLYHSLTFQDYSEKEMLALINEGKLFQLNLGSDGQYNVQLLVVDTPDPIVTAKEFKCCEESTGSAVIIEIPTGEICVADAGAVGSKDREMVSLKTEPGNYKVCAYHFHIPGKVSSVYIVLSKTEASAQNELSEIAEFHEIN